MHDLIRLLPDSVANQIAAGEVVQRPASAVKELLENAIDAGADKIQLIVKEAGKTLIQVTDNGCGMSENDAHLCFARHATSKIQQAEDLFRIRTKGFRGEALASIAAVAQVELRTRRREDAVGTLLRIEGSEIKAQEAVSCPEGSTFLVKNLFFNIPARRNFLKSNQVELRHIIDEFQRVALAHPQVHFEMHHQQSEVFNLPAGNLRQRIVGLFGKNYNERLVPVEETTDIVQVHGFLVKPEHARKTRGEQFFFVNDRFIKSNYLHHAVQAAYKGLIPADSFPSYFLYLDIASERIDINIHPTKTEIKFDDERSVYAILHSALRRSLGMYNISPTLDFETEQGIELPLLQKDTVIRQPTIQVNPNYNPFEVPSGWKSASQGGGTKKETSVPPLPDSHEAPHFRRERKENADLFETDKTEPQPETERLLLQLHQRYILCPIKSGYWIIDQQRAHERILFEKFITALARHTGYSQQQLFPQVVELNPSDFALLKELEEDLRHLGFDLQEFGRHSFAVNGTPADAGDLNPQQLIEQLLEELKHHSSTIRGNRLEALARSLAGTVSIKPGKVLSRTEMNGLIDELFACETPHQSPAGKPTFVTFTLEELEKRMS